MVNVVKDKVDCPISAEFYQHDLMRQQTNQVRKGIEKMFQKDIEALKENDVSSFILMETQRKE